MSLRLGAEVVEYEESGTRLPLLMKQQAVTHTLRTTIGLYHRWLFPCAEEVQTGLAYDSRIGHSPFSGVVFPPTCRADFE